MNCRIIEGIAYGYETMKSFKVNTCKNLSFLCYGYFPYCAMAAIQNELASLERHIVMSLPVDSKTKL